MSTQPVNVQPALGLTGKKFVAREKLDKSGLGKAQSMADGWKKAGLMNPTMVIHLGDPELSFAATAGRKMLEGLRTNQYEEIGRMVGGVMHDIREAKSHQPQIDPKWAENLTKAQNLVQKVFNELGGFRSAFQTYVDHVRPIVENMDIVKAEGIQQVATMETGVNLNGEMLSENIDWTLKALIVTAALEYYHEWLGSQLEQAETLWPGEEQRKNQTSNFQLTSQLVEQKLGDLYPRLAAADGTSEQFRDAISGDSTNAMALNTFVTTGIGLMIQQIAEIVNRYRQEQASQVFGVVRKAVNETLSAGADATVQSSELEAKMLRQQLIDVATLDKLTTALETAAKNRQDAIADAVTLHNETAVAIEKNLERLAVVNKGLQNQAISMSKRHTN